MAASAAHDTTGLMHTRIYVLADDAAAARDETGRRVFSREEIKERTVTDKYTDVRRILVCPSATEQCKALRDFFSSHKSEPGFHDACSGRYQWVMGCARVGPAGVRRAHFSRWPCEHDLCADHAARPLTEEHEDAIDHLCELIARDDLKVIQTCTCPTHVRLSPSDMDPSWAHHGGHNKCLVDWWCSEFGKTHPGFELVKGWRWHPDPSKKTFFVLDLAVLDERGKLLWAIEVQHTHANSAKKREAFKTHKVAHLQFDAKEVLSVCARRDWANSPPYPPLHHHPKSATERWVCRPCREHKRAAEAREGEELAKRARELLERKRKADADTKKAAEEAAKEDAERASKRAHRNAYFQHMGKICREWNAKQMRLRKKWLTTYNKPVNGRFLRGRPGWTGTCKKTDDGWYRLFLMNDSWSFLIMTRDESLRTRWMHRYHESKSILHVQVWDTVPVPADYKYGAPLDCMLPSFMMYDDKDGVERPVGIKDFPPEATMEKYYKDHGVELEEESESSD